MTITMRGFLFGHAVKREETLRGVNRRNIKPMSMFVGGLAAIAEQASRKRRAEEEIERLMYARCKNCEERHDVNGNRIGACVYHPGRLFYINIGSCVLR
jgi:hypothetical protein